MTERKLKLLCRICLSSSCRHIYSNIYVGQSSVESPIYELINYVYDLDISIEDGLPEYVCQDCLGIIKEFENYKKNAQRAKKELILLKGKKNPMLSREMEPFEYAKNSMTANWIKDETRDSTKYNEHHDSETKCNTIKLDVEQDSNDGESIQKEGINFCVNRGNGLKRVRIVEDAMENVTIKADAIKRETDVEELEAYIKSEIIEEEEFVNYDLSEEDRKAKCELEEHTYIDQLSLFVGQEKNYDAVEKKKRHICTFCNKEFKLNSYLLKHLRIHTGENSLKCKYCSYVTSHKSHLMTHIKSHTGEKPYECNYCNFKTVKKSSLITHLCRHTGEKPYHCNLCGFRTTNSTNLRNHILTHTGENPYKCIYCEYTGSNSTNLKSHLCSHTGGKPFKCKYCEYSTSHSSAMRRHQRKHTGEKPFKCDICEYRTANKSNLTTHIRKHTGEKPFKCNLCEFSSSTSGGLRRHTRVGRHTGKKSF